jgi:hypothetical protein
MAKVAKKSASVSRIAPQVPKGMRILEGGFAQQWNQETMPVLEGEVRAVPKVVTLNKGTKKEKETECVEVHTKGGDRYSLWSSATLTPLFEHLSVEKDLPLRIWVAYRGLGVAKKGQNAPKLFDVAIGD